MAQRAVITPDGWISTYPRLFDTLTDQLPPRSWGYWDQIRLDVYEPKIIWMWVIGVCFTAAAVITGYWVLLVIGIPPLLFWFLLATTVIQDIRGYPIATGVIDTLVPHPEIPTILKVGRAIISSGELKAVAVELPLASEIERIGFPVEVRYIDNPTSKYQTVFAARMANNEPGRLQSIDDS